MPRRIDFSSYDIFHAPHYVLPFRIPIPSIVTVHDIIHVTHPERFYYPWIARALISSAVHRADGVLAVSRHTRQGVLTLTGARQDKVRFVPNAIAPRVAPSDLIALPHLEAPYLLAVLSNNKPHKGARDLLLAYQEFRAKKLWEGALPRCPKLVLAGYGTADMMLSRSSASLIDEVDGLHIAGALSAEELRATMTRATALIVPSLVEGFCLPALEAQACGTPVICRPVPALQELVGEHDVVSDDFSVSALAAAIARGLRSGMTAPRQANPKHLELFSCRHVASLVKAEYERVLSGRPA
jgi:glycosyltransferase involved in cell wall biosynthesis